MPTSVDPTRARRRAALALALAISPWVGAALSGCDRSSAHSTGKDEAAPPVAVEAVRPTRSDMAAVYSGTAAIEADHEARVVAKVAGEVTRLLVEEGDQVRAGQVLAVLDGDKLRLEVVQSKAAVDKLERDYARNLELQKKGLIGSSAFDTLRFDLESARASHDLAALQLSYTEVRAPLAGVIAERRVKVGSVLQLNDPLFVVTSPQPLIASVHVPERELSKLAVDQPAAARVDAAGGTFAAHIRRISPVVDPATGTFKVTLEFAPTAALRAGMFARIDIVYERRVNALQIPRSALLESDSGQSVFVVAGGKAQSRPVRTGLVNGGSVEVLSGVSDGEPVVIVGQNGLKSGSDVKIIAPAPTAASHAS